MFCQIASLKKDLKIRLKTPAMDCMFSMLKCQFLLKDFQVLNGPCPIFWLFTWPTWQKSSRKWTLVEAKLGQKMMSRVWHLSKFTLLRTTQFRLFPANLVKFCKTAIPLNTQTKSLCLNNIQAWIQKLVKGMVRDAGLLDRLNALYSEAVVQRCSQ